MKNTNTQNAMRGSKKVRFNNGIRCAWYAWVVVAMACYYYIIIIIIIIIASFLHHSCIIIAS
jgi:hypothetical protein